MTALVVTPPSSRFRAARESKPTLFLAGSIEMGKAVDWQTDAIERFKDDFSIIYNPRRPDWNSDWEQTIDHPEFNAQVNWELDMIAEADMVIIYFDPNTKSPVTLMELGYLAAFNGYKTHVCCPTGFWRKGNVDIICERNKIVTYDTLEALLDGAQAQAKHQQRQIR
jgi:hypothetical protein